MANALSPTFYGTPGREPSEVLGRAFSQGCGGKYVESRILQPGPVAFYGTSNYTVNIRQAAEGHGRDFYYVDNGYLRPGQFDGYFRITRNAEQLHSSVQRCTSTRFERLGLEIAPWRKQGGHHILVVQQSKTYFQLRGMRAGVVLWDTLAEIARHTDRKIVCRPKPTRHTKKRDLMIDLQRAHCVVTYSSNVAVEALMLGIPVVTLGPCAASPLSKTVEEIEEPIYPDREQWAHWLANNQWTLEEIETGVAWRHLQETKDETMERTVAA